MCLILDRKILLNKYTLIGCVDGCIHRGVDEYEIEKNTTPDYRRYISVTMIPACAESSNCGKRRQEIYERAYAECNKVEARYKNFHTRLRKRKEKWDETTAEYKDKPCPFYKPKSIPAFDGSMGEDFIWSIMTEPIKGKRKA